MGYEYFTVEDGPEADFPQNLGNESYRKEFHAGNVKYLPGHWAAYGSFEYGLLATRKSHFRLIQKNSYLIRKILGHAGVDLTTPKLRVKDPVRKTYPEIALLDAIKRGDNKYSLLQDGQFIVKKIPPSMDMGQAIAKVRMQEYSEQCAAGGMAYHNHCWNCDTPVTELMKCSRCKHAVYCSKKCQKKHWMIHKPKCVGPTALSLDEALFSYNLGFLVTAEECKEIYESLDTPEKVKSALDVITREDFISAASATALKAMSSGVSRIPGVTAAMVPDVEVKKEAHNFGFVARGFIMFCKRASELGGFYVW